MQVVELECKLREREQLDSMMLLSNDTVDVSTRIKTPNEIKAASLSRDSLTSEVDAQILRCSDTTNRSSIGQGSSSLLLRGTESLHEIKRKRELRSGTMGESENRISLPTAMERKMATVSDMNKSRKIDPAKAFGRITRTSKVGTTTTQRPFSNSRIGKEQEKTRVWSR